MSGSCPEPTLIGFLCTWCSYEGADAAGRARLEFPKGFRSIRLPCSGRLEPEFVLEAFRNGADGVIVLGCPEGDCHYREGNTRAAGRVRLLTRILADLGIGTARIRFDTVSASDGKRFARLIMEATEELKKLGPLTFEPLSLENAWESNG